MTRRDVAIVARDAGAASALAPVVAALGEDETFRPFVVSWGPARAIFEAEGLVVQPFPEDPAPGEIDALLASVAVVLTGTSLRVELDSCFWCAARAAGIPSMALLDHWKNYAERFTIEAPFDTLPSLVAVMDEIAANELIARGCPPNRVVVTGQPRFDTLTGVVSPEERARARTSLGIDPSRRVAVFASEPRGAPYDDGKGFTQVDALEMFVDAVQAVAEDALVLVKLHPVEQAEPVAAALSSRGGPDARILETSSVREVIAAADVFCGMSSIVLLDAALLGLPTVSIRPGGGPSHFVDAHGDLIASATTAAEGAAAIASGLARGRVAPVSRPPRGATARVVEQLHGLAAATGA
jgi:hypothetical protein